MHNDCFEVGRLKNNLKNFSAIVYIGMSKYIAFSPNGYLPMQDKLIFGSGAKYGRVAAPVRIVDDELSKTMGGLLIGNNNVYKGGKINRIPKKRPIKFLV